MRKEKIDLNLLKGTLVAAAGSGGIRFIEFEDLIQMIFGCTREEMQDHSDIYDLFDSVIRTKENMSRVEKFMADIERGIYKNWARTSKEPLLLFTYDPVSGNKIKWKELMLELQYLVWDKSFDFAEDVMEDEDDIFDEDPFEDIDNIEGDDDGFPAGGYILEMCGNSGTSKSSKESNLDDELEFKAK